MHGIDLGPLMPCLPGRLRTGNRLINLAPELFLKDIERVRDKLTALVGEGLIQPQRTRDTELHRENGHLLLIGRRQLRSNNSWMHNSPRLVNGNPAKPACTVLMHPEDAAERNLKQGQAVQVKSSVGAIVLPVELSDEIMRGVVSIPHGWGHDREGNRLSVAQQNSGASINDLTDQTKIDVICGTAAFNGTLVTVELPIDVHR